MKQDIALRKKMNSSVLAKERQRVHRNPSDEQLRKRRVEEDAENFIKNQIIYICVGVVGGLVIIVGSVVYYCRKKREKLPSKGFTMS